jgi:hypothetical protein
MKKQKCALCHEVFEGYGNNPTPLEVEGVVCDPCNLKEVIPARLRFLGLEPDEEIKAEDTEKYVEIIAEEASKYQVGNRVRFLHAGNETSDEVAEITGYDEDGRYVLLWLDDGSLSTGIMDDNIVLEDYDPSNDDPFYQADDSKSKACDEKVVIRLKRKNK